MHNPATAQPSGLVPIPEVSLDAMEPAVRTQLEEQRTALEAAASSQGAQSPTEGTGALRLGTAFGELGQLYLLYDLTAPARAALTNAAAYEPQEPRWPYLLGTLYEVDSDTERAIESYTASLELATAAGAPGNLVNPIRARLGRSLLAGERLEEAQLQYQHLQGFPDFQAVGLNGLGRIAAAQGDHKRAVQDLSAALAAQPTANQIHYALGLSHRELGQLERARFHLENRGDSTVRFPDPIVAEVQSKADGAGAMLTLGRISLATGEIDTALQRFQRALEIQPDSAAAHKSLASLQLRRGETALAIDLLQQAVVLTPDDVGLRYFVAQLLVDATTATTKEHRAARIASALEHLEEVLALAPDFTEGRALLASTQRRAGRFDGADATYAAGIARDPDAIELHYHRAETIAERIAVQAKIPGAPVESWGAQGRASLSQFLSGIQAAGESWGDDFELGVGLLQLRLGDSAPGRQRLSSLLVTPDIEPKIAARAALYLANEMAQRSAQASAIKSRSDSPSTAEATASPLDNEAVMLYQRALELDPELAEARFNLATLFGRLERFGDAASEYQELIQQDPENSAVRFSHAMALALAGRDGDARQALEQALEVLPSEPVLAHLLTQILVASRDDAVRDAQIGLDLAMRLFDALPTPEHGETVAMALAESGEFAKAVEWQQKVIEQLSEQGTSAESAKRRLDQYQALTPERAPWSG